MDVKLTFLLFVTLYSVSNAVLAPTIQLIDGNNIPILALGTYGSDKDKSRMRQTVNWAVEAGYRHIDTAALYNNEREIGEGLQDVINRGLVRREDMFITTKLWDNNHEREKVVPALQESLNRLGLEYVDLFLIHRPSSEDENGKPLNIDIVETWQGMIEAKRLGLARSIGVSNFDAKQIDRLIASTQVIPAVNEIEIHLSKGQADLVNYCQARGIAVMAYSPFGFLVSRDIPNPPPPKIDDPVLVNIARKYGKTVGQVVLRYLIDRYLIPIPKSTNKARLEENINVFDFRLTEEDCAALSQFDSNTGIF
ncbi:hypothetical protein K1T71_011408 [Dendrolimus kikuchii]|uniref:Uncharacterized protein n=1 Tax=Dendrolimus kikuchii TaxID=765133 RepID=A0ACC1CP35_9NEOP|nr:hypothetical protein K1T71_011408 [Dendrolimus kikuchii]